MAEISFPDGFMWGAATASYQIEGAVKEGGRGETIWDRFSHTPGRIFENQTGDVACDHYHRYRQDVAAMAELGLKTYRFSIAWARLFPSGGGKLNDAGVGFYQRLLDELLAAGIVPAITLYHWDLPQALQDKGGWQNRDTVMYFRDYAARVFELLGDRVPLWITHNEPWVAAFLGHASGVHAPGLRDFPAALQVAHHLLLSHALAVRAFREIHPGAGKIGITLNLSPCYPRGDGEEDLEAARLADGHHNRWFLDPLYLGRYPEDLWARYGELYGPPRIEPGDLELMSADRGDFLGVNYYFPNRVCRPDNPDELFRMCPPDSGAEVTEMGWEVYPEGLYDLLVRLQADYDPPELYVTENGAAYADNRFGAARDTGAPRIEDDDRIGYLREHFRQAWRALQAGVRLRGYYVWSLMDNFEWAYGYSRRFGLLHVDYATQRRTWKKSASWYQWVIAENGF